MPEASACEELGDGECDMGVVVVSSSESSTCMQIYRWRTTVTYSQVDSQLMHACMLACSQAERQSLPQSGGPVDCGSYVRTHLNAQGLDPPL